MRTPILRIAALVTLPILAFGCGGGGGGGSSGSAFEGAYHYVALAGRDPDGPTEYAIARYGTAVASGGDLTLDFRWTDNGTPHAPVSQPGLRYDVRSGNLLQWVRPTFSSAPYAEGGLGRGGAFGVLATTFETADPEVSLVLRRGGDPDESALVGSYHCVGWTYDPDGRRHMSHRGGCLFDGAGGWEGTWSVNEDGGSVIRIPRGFYTLGTGGDLVLNDGETTLVGGLSSDGMVGVLGGGSNPGVSGMAVLVRHHALGGLGDETLRGRYAVATLLHTGLAYVATIGVFDADGAGTWTMSGEGLADGTRMPPTTMTGQYTIDAMGRMNLERLGTREAYGGVSGDGSVAVLASPMGSSIGPKVWILVRL